MSEIKIESAEKLINGLILLGKMKEVKGCHPGWRYAPESYGGRLPTQEQYNHCPGRRLGQ